MIQVNVDKSDPTRRLRPLSPRGQPRGDKGANVSGTTEFHPSTRSGESKSTKKHLFQDSGSKPGTLGFQFRPRCWIMDMVICWQ